ncbi:DUF3263 domain-containing protein [Sphaerisporangium sp. B11E5]|uniref:DUF3263 domain-containing protein n=1 Tax=Sphaerisporangium sp. B11E5 TaxID=3153563 RepID=UPI00325DA08C
MDTAPEHGDGDPEERPAPLAAEEQAPAPSAGPAGELTDRERELLHFERQWWRHAGAKEQAIRETFDISATRYYQLLGQLIARPEAMAHDPMTVKRLQRLRDARRRERAARRFGMRP